MKRPVILLLVSFLLASCAAPSRPAASAAPSLPNSKRTPIEGSEVRKYLIESPRPPYPLEARRLRLAGKGQFWVHFDERSGQVDSVKFVQSIGPAELDNSAVTTFYRWRCKPGALTEAVIPIALAFRMGIE